jgi:CoA:oxalate CoA-transferase
MGRSDLAADQSLRNLHGRIARIDEVTAAIEAWTKTRTREELSALCERYHVPAAPLKDVVEVLRDPHLHERGFLTDHVTEAGVVALPNSPIRYHGAALRPLTPSPALGEHTDEVLAELCGLDEAQLAELRASGATAAAPKC